MHDLRGSYILFLNKPGTTSYGLSSLFILTYQLSCGMHYLILSVPMSLLVLKENPGPHFAQRLFFFNECVFKYYVFSRYLYMLCILAVNVMSRRY